MQNDGSGSQVLVGGAAEVLAATVLACVPAVVSSVVVVPRWSIAVPISPGNDQSPLEECEVTPPVVHAGHLFSINVSSSVAPTYVRKTTTLSERAGTSARSVPSLTTMVDAVNGFDHSANFISSRRRRKY